MTLLWEQGKQSESADLAKRLTRAAVMKLGQARERVQAAALASAWRQGPRLAGAETPEQAQGFAAETQALPTRTAEHR